MGEEARAEWANPVEFILTIIGYAVGLGNVWRFPGLVFDNGGGPFLVIFFAMLFLVGIPMFFLELSIGQFSGLGPTHIFYKMAPLFQGVGYAALIVNAFVGFYYNVIIAYCLYYFIFSMTKTLPWSTCDNSWNDQTSCAIRGNLTCEVFADKFENPKSPSEQYFYNEVLKLSNSLNNLGDLQYPIVIALGLCWLIVFGALSKGVQSLGKVSYVTATFPYIVLTILVGYGCSLPGAGVGIKFYMGLGTFDWSKFGEPAVWTAATGQVFYALSTCTGGLIAMASFNPFKNNVIRDMLLIPILDCLTGFYAGFAIFSVLGYMAQTKCVSGENFADVVAGGPELAFIVYPEGLSLMLVPQLFSCLFFFMMLLLGFGSEFSIMETCMVTVMDLMRKTINTKKKEILVRFIICAVFFILGLSMTAEGGFYILSLINSYIGGYPLLLVGLLQVIVAPWVYGTKRLIQDIESMVGPKPQWFWWIAIISWRFICPIMLGGIIILTIAFPGGPIEVNGNKLPGWADAIGWVIVAIPISVMIGCAVAQAYLYKFNWKKLLSPDDEYYAKKLKNMKPIDEEIEMGDDIMGFSGSKRSSARVTPMKENELYPKLRIATPSQNSFTTKSFISETASKKDGIENNGFQDDNTNQ